MDLPSEEERELHRQITLMIINILISECIQNETDYVPLSYLLELAEVLKDKETLINTAKDALENNADLYNFMHDQLGEENYKKIFYPESE